MFRICIRMEKSLIRIRTKGPGSEKLQISYEEETGIYNIFGHFNKKCSVLSNKIFTVAGGELREFFLTENFCCHPIELEKHVKCDLCFNLSFLWMQSFVLEIVGTNVSTTYITCPADPKESGQEIKKLF